MTGHWHAAPRLRRLAATGVAAAALAVATRQAALLLLAAPAMAVLAAAARPRHPAELAPAVTVSTSRCFEGEDVEIAVTMPATPADECVFELRAEPAFGLSSGAATQVVIGESTPSAHWVVRAAAWGRRVPATITIRCRRAGAWQAGVTVRPGALEVFPHPPPARAALLPPALLRRLGEHVSRVPGEGTEFAGIRGYLPGDRLRDVNWRASSRHASLRINQRAAVRAADLVVVVDAFSEVGPHTGTTLELAVRGAAGLAHAYLRAGDRVGAVALGGMLRWLAPAPGELQYYRIAEMVSDVRYESVVTPNLDRIPRAALSPGTLTVMFTPLLDPRALAAVTDLRARGLPLVAVDVLRHEPPADPRQPLSQLALRLWRLERTELRASLTAMGVPVLTWEEEAGLDAALAPFYGRPLPPVRP